MACFLVPATEAIVVTVVRKVMGSKGESGEKVRLNENGRVETAEKLPFTRKLKWLTNLLYPQAYDVDMVQATQDFYRLFYHHNLTEDEAKELLGSSYQE